MRLLLITTLFTFTALSAQGQIKKLNSKRLSCQELSRLIKKNRRVRVGRILVHSSPRGCNLGAASARPASFKVKNGRMCTTGWKCTGKIKKNKKPNKRRKPTPPQKPTPPRERERQEENCGECGCGPCPNPYEYGREQRQVPMQEVLRENREEPCSGICSNAEGGRERGKVEDFKEEGRREG